MFYDTHIHSLHSHDSKQEPEGNCTAAIEKGLSGIAFTDHADMWYFKERNSWEHIRASVKNAERLNDKYKGRLRVLRGLEVADAYFDKSVTESLIAELQPDVVIGSIHCLSYKGLSDAYSCMDFSESEFSRPRLMEIMSKYFELLTDMAENEDYDILAHLSCPFRYINGKYGRGLRSEEFEEQIKTVLRAVISRSKALEINTSGLGTPFGDTMPDDVIIEWYYRLGGRLLTLGSDAHSAQRVGFGFDETAEKLREKGFTHLAYYENRQPRLLPL
ncbi:MAG: histidinol-phosphatase HisJ family protein [Clostridia bacterium]|nr:histidinol-phosphatase HisJ family protein [Clostridia bacterium]